jgi:hypothetical protein
VPGEDVHLVIDHGQVYEDGQVLDIVAGIGHITKTKGIVL